MLTDKISQHSELIYLALILFGLGISPFIQKLIGRTALRIAIKTETVIDDLILDALRPFRFVYALPAAAAFYLADWIVPLDYEARLISGLVLIFLAVEAAIKVLGAVAAVIRYKAGAQGVSSTGYIDLMKVMTVLVGITIAASLTLESDIFTIIAGLGAATAVAGFIFKDTLHAIFASIRIASWGLIREGDWISVPSYNADGPVEHIGLYDIKVRNWDLTTSLVPTHKILEVANTNYASMQKEARARRIQETLWFNAASIRLCDKALLEGLKEVAFVSDEVGQKLNALGDQNEPGRDPKLARDVGTNFELFGIYVDRYLRSREDLNIKQRFVLVRTLAPTNHGVPLDIFAFVRKTDLIGFSEVQSSIFNHLLSMIAVFDLQLYQSRDQ